MASKKFVSTMRKGFHMTFENGLTISVQWGAGNYCDNHFPENRCYFFRSHARMFIQLAVFKPQLVMTAVPQLVRQSQHIILLAGKIKHQIRMFGCQRTAAKSTAALTVTRRYINPIMLKKVFGNVIKFRRKFFISIQNDFNRFVPRIVYVVAERQRRISPPQRGRHRDHVLCFR